MNSDDIFNVLIKKITNSKLENNKIEDIIDTEFADFKKTKTKEEILTSILKSYIYNEILIEDDCMDIKNNIEESKRIEKSEDLKSYYLKINYSMIEKILEFKKMKFYKKVLEDAKELLDWERIEDSIFNRGYDYDMYKLYCNPKNDRNIIAMFQFIKEEQYKKLEDLKRKNENEYIEKLNFIINFDNRKERILNAVENNHILKKRKNIFEQIIKFFEQENWELVINLLVIQIEGIFFDYTRLKEMNEKKKPAQSLKVKIKTIEDTYYEYILTPFFIYDFIEIRNTIAHEGIMDFEKIELTAKELIMICENLLSMFSSYYLPYNNLIFLCNEIIKNKDSENIELKIVETLRTFDLVLNQDKNTNVYKFLINIEEYKEIFKMYNLENGESVYDYGKDILDELKSEKFWKQLSDYIMQWEECSEENFKFLNCLTQNFINIFPKDSEQKNNIIKIVKHLKELQNI